MDALSENYAADELDGWAEQAADRFWREQAEVLVGPTGVWEADAASLVANAEVDFSVRYTQGNRDLPPGAVLVLKLNQISVADQFRLPPSEVIQITANTSARPIEFRKSVAGLVGPHIIEFSFPEGFPGGASFRVAVGNAVNAREERVLVNRLGGSRPFKAAWRVASAEVGAPEASGAVQDSSAGTPIVVRRDSVSEVDGWSSVLLTASPLLLNATGTYELRFRARGLNLAHPVVALRVGEVTPKGAQQRFVGTIRRLLPWGNSDWADYRIQFSPGVLEDNVVSPQVRFSISTADGGPESEPSELQIDDVELVELVQPTVRARINPYLTEPILMQAWSRNGTAAPLADWRRTDLVDRIQATWIASRPPFALRLSVPASADAGNGFAVRVSAVDERENRATTGDGIFVRLAVRSSAGAGPVVEGLPQWTHLSDASGSSALIPDLRIQQPGVYWVCAITSDGDISGTSNPIIINEPARSVPSASRKRSANPRALTKSAR